VTESTTRDEGLPGRIQPLYRPLEDEGAIVVYAGDLQLSKDSADWLSAGNVELRLKPSPTVEARFSGGEQWLMAHFPGDHLSVSLPSDASLEPPTQSAVPVRPDDAPRWVADLRILINELVAGETGPIERVVLHIHGPFPDFPLPGQQTSQGIQGQLPFTLPGWGLRLARAAGPRSENDFSFVVEAVPDPTPVSPDDIKLMIRRVFMLLSFIAGTEVGVGPRAGLDGTGQVVWAWWGPGRAGERRPGWRWCPDHLVNDALPALADGMTLEALAADPALEACIDRAVNLLGAANGPGVLDVRIPIACSGLELMAWAVLQHHQWLSAEDLGRLSSGSRARLLLQWAQIPIGLPAGSTALDARRRRLGQQSAGGPEMIFGVRNDLVHPPKRFSDPEWPTWEELFEASQLATRYLELVILRVLGYTGEYVNRLQPQGWETDTEPVPWAPVKA